MGLYKLVILDDIRPHHEVRHLLKDVVDLNESERFEFFDLLTRPLALLLLEARWPPSDRVALGDPKGHVRFVLLKAIILVRLGR
jgi:hypothetical protein